MALLTGTVAQGTNGVVITPTGGVATEVKSHSVASLQVFASKPQPQLALPASITGTVFPPGVPVNDLVPANAQWYVRININDGTYVDLPMGSITNKGTWVNTQAGAEIARTEVSAWLT